MFNTYSKFDHQLAFGFENLPIFGIGALENQSELYEFWSFLKETTDLIIIGYSFPYFNQEIDEFYLKAILGSVNLKNIVIQDPVFSKEEFIGRFDFGGILTDLESGISVSHITSTDQFFIPRDVRFETE